MSGTAQRSRPPSTTRPRLGSATNSGRWRRLPVALGHRPPRDRAGDAERRQHQPLPLGHLADRRLQARARRRRSRRTRRRSAARIARGERASQGLAERRDVARADRRRHEVGAGHRAHEVLAADQDRVGRDDLHGAADDAHLEVAGGADALHGRSGRARPGRSAIRLRRRARRDGRSRSCPGRGSRSGAPVAARRSARCPGLPPVHSGIGHGHSSRQLPRSGRITVLSLA